MWYTLKCNMSKLYKIELTSKINGLSDRTEYIRSSSEKTIKNMLEQCFVIKNSEYFGYDNYSINIMKLSNFPELMTIKI